MRMMLFLSDDFANQSTQDVQPSLLHYISAVLQRLALSAFSPLQIDEGVADLNTTKVDISTFLSCLALCSQAAAEFVQFRLRVACTRREKTSQMLINRFGLNNRIVMDAKNMPNWIIIATWALFECDTSTYWWLVTLGVSVCSSLTSLTVCWFPVAFSSLCHASLLL